MSLFTHGLSLVFVFDGGGSLTVFWGFFGVPLQAPMSAAAAKAERITRRALMVR
jgi:hypothetical protein